MDEAETAAVIRAQALVEGFDAVGFAPASLGTSARAELAAFLAAGYHGDMGWLAEKADRRGEPQVLWPEARTVIALGLSYAPAAPATMDPACGAISVYAQGRDYHDGVKKKLKALAGWMHRRFGCEVKVFVDTAPVMEKPLAVQAGLGWQGRHTNLVSRRFGSWLFLGEIYTTLALPPDTPGSDHCGRCAACLAACPTGAFPAPHRLDARRCISYLTIEHRGPIDVALRPLIGNRVYGCDACLSACPWNKFARAAREAAFMPRADLVAPRLAELAVLDDAGFRARFAGSPVKRIGRERFVRNVLIALGNSGESALAPVAAALTGDAAAVVADAAGWALARLAPSLQGSERASER